MRDVRRQRESGGNSARVVATAREGDYRKMAVSGCYLHDGGSCCGEVVGCREEVVGRYSTGDYRDEDVVVAGCGCESSCGAVVVDGPWEGCRTTVAIGTPGG